MWGWELFFAELCYFLQSVQRQHGVANESFSYYALERVEISCRSLETVLHQMRTSLAEGRMNEDESATVVEYCALLAELIQCLHSTAHEWENYLDRLLQVPNLSSYLAPSSAPVGLGLHSTYLRINWSICHLCPLAGPKLLQSLVCHE